MPSLNVTTSIPFSPMRARKTHDRLRIPDGRDRESTRIKERVQGKQLTDGIEDPRFHILASRRTRSLNDSVSPVVHSLSENFYLSQNLSSMFKHRLKHRLRQFSRERILLAGVIGAYQRHTIR